MTEKEARAETIKIFGEDSFTEVDGQRYYVGPLPKHAGPYTGYMGFSWEEVIRLARAANPPWQEPELEEMSDYGGGT